MNPLARLRQRFFPTAALAPAKPDQQPLYRQTAVYKLFDWMAGIPDPDEVLRRTGRTRADLRQLLRDAEVSQAIDTRREAVLATPWRFEPGSSRAEKFITAELTPHMPKLVGAAWQATLYGYSVAEVVYGKRGGKVGIDAVHEPPFEWFRPLPDGSLRYFPETGEGGATGIECNPRKFFLTARNPSYRNPYGEALLSVLYWPVSWRLQGWQLWLNFLETFGAPIVIGKTASYDKFVAAMQAQGVTRTVGWQPMAPDETVTTITASTAGEFERLESALDRCIQRVVLGQTLTSDVGKSGSYAAAKVHDEVREDKRRADVRMVSDTVQRLVSALWQLNGFPGAAPQFVMQDDVGLERERADRDAILAEKLGVRFTEEYVTDRYDLEPGDFTIVDPEPPPAASDPADNSAPAKPKLAALSAPKFTPEQQVLEDGIAQLASDVALPIPLAELRSAILAAQDREDLEARLALLLDRQDPAFADLVARAAFAGHVIGYVHADAG
jgi:phage gp29-like protein